MIIRQRLGHPSEMILRVKSKQLRIGLVGRRIDARLVRSSGIEDQVGEPMPIGIGCFPSSCRYCSEAL